MDDTRVIFFGDEDDEAYGNVKSFKNIEDFKYEIEKQLGYKVQLSNIRVEKCIMTSEGIPCDLLVPISTTDLDINTYYIADLNKICNIAEKYNIDFGEEYK